MDPALDSQAARAPRDKPILLPLLVGGLAFIFALGALVVGLLALFGQAELSLPAWPGSGSPGARLGGLRAEAEARFAEAVAPAELRDWLIEGGFAELAEPPGVVAAYAVLSGPAGVEAVWEKAPLFALEDLRSESKAAPHPESPRVEVQEKSVNGPRGREALRLLRATAELGGGAQLILTLYLREDA